MKEQPSDNRSRGANKHDVGIQADITSKQRGYTFTVPKWFVWMTVLSVLSGLVYLVTDQFLSRYRPRWYLPPEVLEEVGVEGVILFRQHDRDSDGVLSLEEFEPLAHRLVDIDEAYSYDEEIEEWDEVVTLATAFQPLKLDSLSKDLDSLISGPLDSLTGLKNWQKANHEWQNFGASVFEAFLPKDPAAIEDVGAVYYIVEPAPEAVRGATLSSNRYNPPRLIERSEITLHRLLMLLHPRPFVFSRFAPQGATATIRAVNENFVHIVFRAHAEFQLNEPPFYPFWFTPAQFVGEVILHRRRPRLLHFSMHVPTDKRLNVDMEWLNGPRDAHNMEVDIGYMPEMRVDSTRSSLPAIMGEQDNRNTNLGTVEDYRESLDAIKWSQEISEAEARRKLEVHMYPFKEVEYHNFSSVWPAAAAAGRPVHSVLLWGALDDQSC